MVCSSILLCTRSSSIVIDIQQQQQPATDIVVYIRRAEHGAARCGKLEQFLSRASFCCGEYTKAAASSFRFSLGRLVDS